MRKLLLAVLSVAIVTAVACSSGSTTGQNRYPKDLNITKDTCLKVGEVCDIPPADEITDKCCDSLMPALFTMSQDGSTGYSHYRCIYANKCTPDGSAVEFDAYVACCSGLVIMGGKCVAKGKCATEDEQIFVTAPLDQKECVDFPACVRSGTINRNTCEYCCAGSKYTTQMITGLPPEKCLGPDESLTADEVKFGWTEPVTISQESYDSFKTECLASHKQ